MQMLLARIISADLNVAVTMASAEMVHLAVTLMSVQTVTITVTPMLLVSTPKELLLVHAMTDIQETELSVLISMNVQMVPIIAQPMALAPTLTEALHVAVMMASMATVLSVMTMTNAHLLRIHVTRARAFVSITSEDSIVTVLKVLSCETVSALTSMNVPPTKPVVMHLLLVPTTMEALLVLAWQVLLEMVSTVKTSMNVSKILMTVMPTLIA